MTPLIVIPAAGASSRMCGRDKLLEIVDGIPLLCRQTNVALATGLDVLVLLRPSDTERRNSLPSDPKLQVSSVPDAEEGIAATLRSAATAANDKPLMILLPDVPGITTADVQKILTAFNRHGGTKIVRASDPDSHPGTPICLPANVLAKFSVLKGDEGGRKLLLEEDVELVRFDTNRATRDLNTPEDWKTWRAEYSDV
ncbi:MAG: nucleotidyltransferase family protein [Boseongicola sp.]